MSKHIFPLIVVSMLCLSIADTSARSQSRRVHHSPDGWSVTASLNTPSDIGSSLFADGHYLIGCVDMYPSNTRLEYIYQDYHDETRSTGGLGVGAEYKFNHWIGVGVDLGATFYYHNSYDAINPGSEKFRLGAAISLMPKVKMFYMDRPKCRLYTSLSLGIAAYPGFYLAEEKVRPAYQMTMFGVEFGKDLCGFVETGFGIQFSGLKAGVAYKF